MEPPFFYINLNVWLEEKTSSEDSPAEFFAVVTEYFFEEPARLRKKHPRLYEQLRLFYRQDPARSRIS